MKPVLTIILLTFALQSLSAQDLISKKDKSTLNVRIIEQTNREVRYKMADYEDGPVLSIKLNRISKIEYKNGYIDLLGNQNPRKNKAFGINAGTGKALNSGGGIVLGSLDYFVLPQVDLEMNFGASDMSGGVYFAAGSRFHLNSSYSEKKLTPFTGILLGAYYGKGIIQLPLGINYLGNSGFDVSLSGNEMIVLNSYQIVFLELRLGWRFKL